MILFLLLIGANTIFEINHYEIDKKLNKNTSINKTTENEKSKSGKSLNNKAIKDKKSKSSKQNDTSIFKITKTKNLKTDEVKLQEIDKSESKSEIFKYEMTEAKNFETKEAKSKKFDKSPNQSKISKFKEIKTKNFETNKITSPETDTISSNNSNSSILKGNKNTRKNWIPLVSAGIILGTVIIYFLLPSNSITKKTKQRKPITDQTTSSNTHSVFPTSHDQNTSPLPKITSSTTSLNPAATQIPKPIGISTTTTVAPTFDWQNPFLLTLSQSLRDNYQNYENFLADLNNHTKKELQTLYESLLKSELERLLTDINTVNSTINSAIKNFNPNNKTSFNSLPSYFGGSITDIQIASRIYLALMLHNFENIADYEKIKEVYEQIARLLTPVAMLFKHDHIWNKEQFISDHQQTRDGQVTKQATTTKQIKAIMLEHYESIEEEECQKFQDKLKSKIEELVTCEKNTYLKLTSEEKENFKKLSETVLLKQYFSLYESPSQDLKNFMKKSDHTYQEIDSTLKDLRINFFQQLETKIQKINIRELANKGTKSEEGKDCFIAMLYEFYTNSGIIPQQKQDEFFNIYYNIKNLKPTQNFLSSFIASAKCLTQEKKEDFYNSKICAYFNPQIHKEKNETIKKALDIQEQNQQPHTKRPTLSS